MSCGFLIEKTKECKTQSKTRQNNDNVPNWLVIAQLILYIQKFPWIHFLIVMTSVAIHLIIWYYNGLVTMFIIVTKYHRTPLVLF